MEGGFGSISTLLGKPAVWASSQPSFAQLFDFNLGPDPDAKLPMNLGQPA